MSQFLILPLIIDGLGLNLKNWLNHPKTGQRYEGYASVTVRPDPAQFGHISRPKRTFHIMRDQTDGRFPISGGAWGARQHKEEERVNLASLFEQMLDGSGENVT